MLVHHQRVDCSGWMTVTAPDFEGIRGDGTGDSALCCEDDYERSGPRPREVVFCRSIWAASRIADRIMVCRSWMSSRS